MGMYTELVLKCEISEDIDKQVEDVLQFLFNGGSKPTELPAHPFFSTGRWEFIGSCSSFYHTPFALSRYYRPDSQKGGGYVFSRSDLKNYGREIEEFLDWIMPYISEHVGMCIGWKWYEDWDKPELLFKS